jgi:shikimate kinase
VWSYGAAPAAHYLIFCLPLMCTTLLIGPRACGKSTIGPLLARALGQPFVEVDELALQLTGLASVQDVWRRLGEDAWRAVEAEAFASALMSPERIIALGGGAPTVSAIESVIQHQRKNGEVRVVYLRCEVAELRRRLAADPGDRPSLTRQGIVDEVEQVVAARDPIYRRMADVICDTTLVSASEAADRIVREFSRRKTTG